MKNFKEAFIDFNVAKEKHKGNIDYFIYDTSFVCPGYSKGDIVFVKKDKKMSNDNHIFVIIDDELNGKLITTTKTQQLIKKDNINNLLCDSYLAEEIYKIDSSRILFKIGELKNYIK